MNFNKRMMGSGWNLSLLLSWITAAFSQCDYFQDVAVGSTYYVYSPNYPNLYPPYTNCRWYALSPPGTRISLSCPVVDIPQSPSCKSDRLSISRSGDLAMTDADHFCGRGSFDQQSDTNKMNVVLVASSMTPGGKFLCSITAQNLNLPTTTPPPEACDCGWKQKTKIVGGSETGVNEYPMMAGLIDANLRMLYCGATIISPRFVLTAAHCLSRHTPDDVGVLIGDHDLSTGTDTASSQLLKVIQFTSHPQYDQESQVNDIAVIKVERDIEYSQQVGPACLPFRSVGRSFEGETVTALGWGTTDFGGPMSDVLKQTQLVVQSQPSCVLAYTPGTITDSQMCTHAADTDACQADSGGPLLWQDPNTRRQVVIGVISYGIACATEKPGVNARVASYLDWIEQATQEMYCRK